MRFEETLHFGQAAESDIAKWIQRKGYAVLPVYEKLIDTGKGPQLFTATTQLVAPDMLVFRGSRVMWIEAKHKTAFSWHRRTQRWVTGIDLRHYEDYCTVDASTPWPVHLLFLHRGGEALGQPGWEHGSPTGLFHAPMRELQTNENHRHNGWGRSGMVYWSRRDDGGALTKVAELADVLSRAASPSNSV